MKRSRIVVMLLGLTWLAACESGPLPRSDQSFDEIARQVAAMNAAEIADVLGEPDSRQLVFLRDERWIWWNYTFLDGEDYPPEVRGQMVHLEITFRKPSGQDGDASAYSEWRIAQPFGVAYRALGSSLTTAGTAHGRT